MSKTKKSRKQVESSEDSSSDSEESSPESSSGDQGHSRKTKKKSRKMKKRKSKRKATHSDDNDGSGEGLRSKRSKKASKHKKSKRRRCDSDAVEVEKTEKVLYISSDAEGGDDRHKHYDSCNKRVGELRMLREIGDEKFRSKWDSPHNDVRENPRSVNYTGHHHDEDDGAADRYSRRNENNSQYRRHYEEEEDAEQRPRRGPRYIEPPDRRYEDQQHRYEREPHRHEFKNRSPVGDREHLYGRRNLNEKRSFDSDARREQPGGRITRNPFDRKVSEIGSNEPRHELPQRRDEYRRFGRDEHKRNEPRRNEFKGEEFRRVDSSRRNDDQRRDEPRREDRGRQSDRTFQRRHPNDTAADNRFDDSRRHRPKDRKSADGAHHNVHQQRDSVERRHQSPRSPRPQRNRRHRRDSYEDSGNHEWGKKSSNFNDNEKDPPVEKEKPNFGLSGKLTEDTNKVNGVVINYAEPPEARKPKRRWRLYPFKGTQSLQTFYIHRQSCFLIGRDRKICDIPIDHPSCSKQHAVLQYRLVPYEKEDGTTSKRVRPYILDMSSANGTFVNNNKIEAKKYVELLEKDVIKFGYSSREYVLLHENSKDDNLDDDIQFSNDIANDHAVIKTEED